MGREKHASETNMVEVMLLHWYVECGHKCVTVNRYVRVNWSAQGYTLLRFSQMLQNYVDRNSQLKK